MVDAWRSDNIRVGDGILARWRLAVLGVGEITVEHHANCGRSCPRGWWLKGKLFGDGEALKAKTAEAAKTEALAKLRARLHEILGTLGA